MGLINIRASGEYWSPLKHLSYDTTKVVEKVVVRYACIVNASRDAYPTPHMSTGV